MNLVAFPIKEMDLSILRRIIQGGIDKLKEADVVLIGGHSVEDKELKYGMSVTGFVHPDHVLTKKSLQKGDQLILTKPLGTGIVNTAIKAGLAPVGLIDTVTRLMAELNRKPAEIMARYPVHACTDITGFGLLGHLCEMIENTGLGLVLDSTKIPILSQASEYATMGLVPGGAYKNREFREAMIDFSPTVPRWLQDILFDPQTSGGLLIGLDARHADSLFEALKSEGIDHAAVIGEVTAGPKARIAVH
jgi:selenide, water dikinase